MIEIDARGMRCPWPAIRLARAMRDGGEDILIHADDPAAPAEIARVAKAAGARVETAGEGAFHILRSGMASPR